MSKRIGLLGGTFDPIHNGHLAIAAAEQQQQQLDQVQFIPCPTPPHRQTPSASIEHRINMIKLAIADQPQFQLNELELQRSGPSYTIDTLIALAKPNQCLYFIMGADNYLKFEQWHRWQEIPQYCQLLVYNRPGYPTEMSKSQFSSH